MNISIFSHLMLLISTLDLEVLYIGTTDRMESKLIPSLNIDYVGIEMKGLNRKNILKNIKENILKEKYNTFIDIYNSFHSIEIKELLRRNYPYPDFQENPASNQLVWDLISAAIVIDPTIIMDYAEERLDVDDVPGSPTYGKSFTTDQICRQRVRILLKIDQKRFWNIVMAGLSRW